jgi:chromosomal replication initiator protein
MYDEKNWQKVLDLIRDQISSGNFRTWFSNTQLKDFNDTSVTIAVPSAFIKGQLISRYEGLIIAAIKEIIGTEITIIYEIDPSLSAKKTTSDPTQTTEDLFLDTVQIPGQQVQVILNPRYTLENFVVGGTNNLAYAAAQAVSQNPGTSYNPLFVYGPSGVGKTHLMQGIGNAILKKNPHAKLVYASSERFTTDFVDSLQSRRSGDFRFKYRNCDVLLIDDIQFISGKDSTQEEFFHTFNELYTKNAQIVLTSDRPPQEMQKLESRLMSRFQGGLMVDIQLPDYETRMAVLKAKLVERGETVPEEILQYIAENVVSNSRELEGKLIQILQMSKLMGTSPDFAIVQKVIGSKPAQPQKQINYQKVIEGVNSYFNVNQEDLMGPRRQKELVFPRQIAMYVMYEECHMPMEKIGQILGNRDHTTVLHGIEKIKESLTRDREIQRVIIEFKQHIISL